MNSRRLPPSAPGHPTLLAAPTGTRRNFAKRLSGGELERIYLSLFQRLVRRATWRHGLSKEDASDVVQDAFVLALVKLAAKGNPEAWLYRTVDHLSVNWSRKIQRRTRLLEAWRGPADDEDLDEKDVQLLADEMSSS